MEEKRQFVGGKGRSENFGQFYINRGVMEIVPESFRMHRLSESTNDGDGEEITDENVAFSARVFVPRVDPNAEHTFTVWAYNEKDKATLKKAAEEGAKLPNLLEIRHAVMNNPESDMHNRVIPRYLLSVHNSALIVDSRNRLKAGEKNVKGKDGETMSVPYTEAYVRGPIFNASEYTDKETGKDMYRAVVRSRGFTIPVFIEKATVDAAPHLREMFDQLLGKAEPADGQHKNIQVVLTADMYFKADPEYGLTPKIAELKSLYNPYAKTQPKAENRAEEKTAEAPAQCAEEAPAAEQKQRSRRAPGM